MLNKHGMILSIENKMARICKLIDKTSTEIWLLKNYIDELGNILNWEEARWKKAGFGDYECSLCGEKVSKQTPFCAICGANMKGE